MSVEIIAAILLIAVPIAFNLAFFELGRTFDYPNILREPADTILRRFAAGGTPLLLRWQALLVSALAMLPLVALVGVVSLTNVYLFTWRFTELRRHAAPYYLHQDDVAALGWLAQNAGPADVVLAPAEIGQFVPNYGESRAYLAHWAMTNRFFERRANVEQFFDPASSDEWRRTLLRSEGVTLVLRSEWGLPSDREFDPGQFLAVIGESGRLVRVTEKRDIYTQGASADAVFFIQTGIVRLTVVAHSGNVASIAVLNAGECCGEGCLTGQSLRLGSAVAMTNCALIRIEKKAMLQALHREPRLADMFIAYLLGRNVRYEADLVDHLFSSGEKRLARTLLLLAHFGKEGRSETIGHKISQETLAEMIGTTRSRVNVFMKKFKRLGFLEYDGGLKINPSLLTIIVHD